MTIRHRVTYTLTVVGLLVVGAVLMTLAWMAPGVTDQPQPHLMLAGTLALALSALGLFAGGVDWLNRQAPLEECRECCRLWDPDDLEPISTGGKVCVECLAPRTQRERSR